MGKSSTGCWREQGAPRYNHRQLSVTRLSSLEHVFVRILRPKQPVMLAQVLLVGLTDRLQFPPGEFNQMMRRYGFSKHKCTITTDQSTVET